VPCSSCKTSACYAKKKSVVDTSEDAEAVGKSMKPEEAKVLINLFFFYSFRLRSICHTIRATCAKGEKRARMAMHTTKSSCTIYSI